MSQNNKKDAVLKGELLKKNEQESVKRSNNSAEDILREMHDEISPEATPLWLFVNDNAPKIATIVVSLVLIISGLAFYNGYKENALDEARLKLSSVVSIANYAERLKALEAFKKDAPNVLLVAVNYEIARVALLADDFATAQNAFSAVVEKEGQSPLGVMASVNLADMYVKAGDTKRALAIYESIVNKLPTELRVQFEAGLYASIGEIAAAAKMNKEAISAYKKAIDALPKDGSAEQDINFFNAQILQLL